MHEPLQLALLPGTLITIENGKQAARREAARQRGLIKRAAARENGLCSNCGGAPPAPGRKCCAKCLERVRSKKERERMTAKALGLCGCGGEPVPGKLSCKGCLMRAIVKEAFKHPINRRRGLAKGRSQHFENGCYVNSYRPEYGRAVCAKFDGRCFYSGLPIDIGSTAGLDHNIPVSRVSAWGEAVVYSPDNLVWCHQGMNYLKGDRTGVEFKQWLQAYLPRIMAFVSD